MITNRASNNTYYNYTDLNRVEAKTFEVAKHLTDYAYTCNIKSKTN